ncbi:serine endoprotease DegQ, partial [Salmonella enterica subsp. enterica serovar Poona]
MPGQAPGQATLPSLAPLLEKVLPAVVSVKVEGTAAQSQKVPEEFKKFFGEALPAQPSQACAGRGAGGLSDAGNGWG